MRLADDPAIPAEVHDIARLLALEHLVSSLWFCFACNQAEARGEPAGDVAKTLRDGVIGTMVEGTDPPQIRALIRDHAAKVMDHCVASARRNDELRKAGDIQL